MGKRGPKSRPNHLKIAEGVREDRINRDEPTPSEVDAEEILEPPIELNEYAREVWDRLVPDLVDKFVMTTWDVDEFAQYCVAAGTARLMYENLQSLEDYTARGAAGGVIKSPYWQIWRDAQATMRQLAARFGLDPANRSDLKIGDTDTPENGAERLLG
jgi:P27 family predicted phage terminase small subunit